MKLFISLIFLRINSNNTMKRSKTTIYPVLCLIFLMFPCAVFAETDLYRQADTAKKCSICHYRWIYTFYVEHRGTPLAPLDEEKVVGKQEMCLSCHDGSVRDSRDRICNDPGHRIGAIPSSRVSIPEKFPLDENGALQCVTCHTPHALSRQGAATDELFLRAPNVNSSFCKQCHVTKLGGQGKGNHPVDILPLKNPDLIIKAGGRLGTDPKNHIICETCHIPHGGVNNKFLVLSVEDPKTRSVLCEVCHSKKPGLAKDQALNRFSHPLDLTPGLTVTMPDKWKNGKKLVRGTGGELVCRTCHIPHGAVDKKYLLAEHNYRDSICVECHSEKRNIADSSHDLRVMKPDEMNIQGHRVSGLGPCSPCHLVHAGSSKLMWAREAAMDEKPGEFCFSCHSKGKSAGKVMPEDFSHPMEITLAEEKSSSSLPLFDEKGINMKGKIRCSTCHDFHNPFPLYDDNSENGKKHSKFLRLSQKGSSGICVDCHPWHGLVEGTDHDLNITAPDFINISGQTPAQSGVCGPCHVAHNAGFKKFLWSAPAGPSLPKGWNPAYTTDKDIMARLCTGCHSPGKIAEKHVPKFGLHPREKMVEGKPLLALEIHKDEFPTFTDTGEIADNGNIVCSTCHNPHQWDPDVEAKGPGEIIEGDSGNSFLRADLHSVFCTGCHGIEGLIKFTYFHRSIGRLKKDAPFTVK